MKPFQNIPIPDRMKHLPLDRRGYPIFYVALVSDGVPVFTANDASKMNRCVQRKLCHVCGTSLFRGSWFVGGPMSAFHASGVYADGPMHSECAHYALRVCPYLALASYRGEIASKQAQALVKKGVMVAETTMLPGQPPVFVAIMAVGFTLAEQPFPLPVNFRPHRPYRVVEYWRHGQQITEEEASKPIFEYVDLITQTEPRAATLTFGVPQNSTL